MRRTELTIGLALLFAACNATNSEFDDDGSIGSSGTGMGGGIDLSGSSGSGNGPEPCLPTDPNVDDDGDGFTELEGDCNDCDPNVNPAAIEVATPVGGVPVDENCNGQIDEFEPCDSGINPGDTNPLAATRALDMCSDANTVGWGVVSAKYVRANGAPATAGINVSLPTKFGNSIIPQRGQTMMVMSSGYAYDANSPNGCQFESCDTTGFGTAPPGFPQDVAGCEGDTAINDDIGLEVTLRAPKNAKGYAFNFAFMSFEFAEWVCTPYNDQFIALVSPPPAGSVNGNISFDSKKNPVSVNLALFDHCSPSTLSNFAAYCSGSCPNPPQPYCPNGQGFMNGTGFNEWGDSGSTGWLVTSAPVNGGDQFTIRFAIWDTGDTALDSTVVLDNFQWTAEPGTGIGTEPVPDPK